MRMAFGYVAVLNIIFHNLNVSLTKFMPEASTNVGNFVRSRTVIACRLI